MTRFWDIVRIAAYAVISMAFAYNAIDDNVRGSRMDIVWVTLAAEHIGYLALLALNLSDMVVWVDTRLYLTPTTAIAAVAVAWQTSQRLIARRRMEGAKE